MKEEKEEKKVGKLVNITGDVDPKKLGKVYLVEFHWFGKRVGSLEFKGEKLHFKGDVNKSAKLFFDVLKEFVEQYIQERLISECQGVYSSKLLDKLNTTLVHITESQQIIRQIEQLVENLATDALERKRKENKIEEAAEKNALKEKMEELKRSETYGAYPLKGDTHKEHQS